VVWKASNQVACAIANCPAGTIFSQVRVVLSPQVLQELINVFSLPKISYAATYHRGMSSAASGLSHPFNFFLTKTLNLNYVTIMTQGERRPAYLSVPTKFIHGLPWISSKTQSIIGCCWASRHRAIFRACVLFSPCEVLSLLTVVSENSANIFCTESSDPRWV
jgi:hypothetical protein